MKKQLLAAAVAATMTSVAMADISITGNSKFEYFNQDDEGTKTNYTNTEVNLNVKGQTGETSVVANFELSNRGNNAADGTGIDVEDLYMTTKVGDVTVKAGSYASSTSSILGEIDNGGRADDKVTLTTTLGGATVYVGNSGSASATGSINNNMFAGVKMDVAGMTVQAKKVDEDTDAYGIAGSVSGVDFRLEQKADTAANGDVTFGQISTSTNGFDLSYAWIDADKANKIDENDSAIFAVENGHSDVASTDTGNKQFTAKTSVAGNAVTFKTGSVEKGISATADLDYTQISASRALASGATATVTYTDMDQTASTSKETLEIDLSVKF